MAHRPVISEDPLIKEKFCSLRIKADIWSVGWAPDNQMIPTDSEDQSTIIWKFDRKSKELEKFQVL